MPSTEEQVVEALRLSWARETSYEPDKWSPENPAWGQCAVSALIVQDLLGGELLTGKVNGIEHYWNILPDGRSVDVTKDQFGPVRTFERSGVSDRQFVLSFPATQKRYDELRRRVLQELSKSAQV